MFLSIIIPLYNEQDLILPLLDRLLALRLPDFITQMEVVITDDKSNDQSLARVQAYASQHQRISVVAHAKNMGKGAAVRTGIEQAKGELFLIQDADMELSPDDIPSMLQALFELNIQFVNGSRYLPGVHRPLSSYKRYLANRLFTFATSLLIDVKLTDMACGYKLIHRQLYQQITLKENRFGFEAELIIKAMRIKRNNVAEVPVKYFPRNEGEGKKLRNTDGFKILWTITKYGLLRMN